MRRDTRPPRKPFKFVGRNCGRKFGGNRIDLGGTPRAAGWSTNDVLVSFKSIENPSGVNGRGVFRGPDVIQIVTVSTSYTQPSLGFLDYLGLPSPVIHISHSERITGPS